MTDIVPSDQIETIVGAKRHFSLHFGRILSENETVYILHSVSCKALTPDLRDCIYSRALDQGIDLVQWSGWENIPGVQLAVTRQHGLVPAAKLWTTGKEES